MTLDGVLLALMIFVLRVVNNTLGTVRVVLITREKRLLASMLGFVEALVFAVVIANVVQDLSNWMNLVAYCGGFSVGNFLGMALEHRFITSYKSVSIITDTYGHEIAAALRDGGFGVTEAEGEGRDGHVSMLRSVVISRDVPRVIDTVRDMNPEAFIALEDARAVHRGYIRATARSLRR